ncbi:MAG TPA: hypothetical protein VMA98_02455 [Candidatus Acidoferrales bacterium]|nr:hypothetical protein [Candidatus Acidoferrales bacterium]
MAEHPELPHRTGHSVLDFVIATCAVVISLASLWVALRADQTQEQLLKASVWPYVTYDTSDVTPEGRPRIEFILTNEGVGPAIVRSFAVAYNGKYVGKVHDLLKACCDVAGEPHVRVFSSTVQSQVIMAHQTLPFIIVLPKLNSTHGYARALASRFNVSVKMCYCSVVGECWFLDSREDQPQAVSKCPPAQQPQYTS